jgi:hypothetical protein
MASLGNHIDEAIEKATKAIEAEKCGNLVEAKQVFGEAVGLFLQATKLESNPQKKALLKNQALEFLERAEKVPRNIS